MSEYFHKRTNSNTKILTTVLYTERKKIHRSITATEKLDRKTILAILLKNYTYMYTPQLLFVGVYIYLQQKHTVGSAKYSRTNISYVYYI